MKILESVCGRPVGWCKRKMEATRAGERRAYETVVGLGERALLIGCTGYPSAE